MAENITRCPKCKTSFRISDAHLKSAKGAVRCGSCLNIFNAKEHLISSKQEAPAPAPTKPQTKKSGQPPAPPAKPKKPETKVSEQAQAASSFAKAIATKSTGNIKAKPPTPQAKPISRADDEDDILISDDMDNKGGSKYDESFNSDDFNDTELGHSSTGQYDVSLFERLPDDDRDDDDSDSDESWALDLLNEDSDPPPPAPTQKELEEEEERQITQEFEASFNFKVVDDTKPVKPESQESFDFEDYPDSEDSGFATGEFDAVKPPVEKTKPSATKQDSKPLADTSFEDDYDVGYDDGYDVGYDDGYDTKLDSDQDYDVGYDASYEEDYEDDYEDEKNVLKDDETYSESIDQIKESYFEEEEYSEPFEKTPAEKESSNYLDAIEPEPVEFSFKRHSTFWQSNILWGTLSIVAGIALFIQIAKIKFDTLSLIEPYRSYYGMACKYADCTLPELVNRSKIRTANLVVRSHPKIKDALIVDAVLQNTAKFEQSFPTLDLVFTNSREKPVSARRLAPSEYLRGELAGRTNMPVKQPVHIAIEISDPGPEAVGYRISIVD